MLEIPGQPLLDKRTLIGGCARLPLHADEAALRAEIAALPADLWKGTGGRVGVHKAANAIFLRGYAPAEGNKPIEDRPVLELLPRTRELIGQAIPASAMRCLLARLPPGAVIAPHIDRAPYFWQTIRLHVPVETHDRAWMLCDGLVYVMAAGEVWALNNNASHAVWNDHDTQWRTHLICDFLPSDALNDLLACSERGLGRSMPEVAARASTTQDVMTAAG